MRKAGRRVNWLCCLFLVACLLLQLTAVVAAPGRKSTAKRPTASPAQRGAVYPEFRHPRLGVVRWLPEQMPIKVYVSRGLCLDGYIDQQYGGPMTNFDNRANWPKLVRFVLTTPGEFEKLSIAREYTDDMWRAAVQGIQMWKPFEKEGLFSYELTDDPQDATVHVFWTHHFTNKLGMALFANDIRGCTSKDLFPYTAIQQGLADKIDFTPVVVLLRTTDGPQQQPMPLGRMVAAAAHEMGHVLGIDGHSNNAGDLMNVFYGRGVISINDAATIRYLYRLQPQYFP